MVDQISHSSDTSPRARIPTDLPVFEIQEEAKNRSGGVGFEIKSERTNGLFLLLQPKRKKKRNFWARRARR
ncbi:hypothetical protein KFK09_011903 [Dendrobium nobile]|uniref:Uncharacterized protein n=1 Tax=Dendrobium nobile TaxID=94219 RepID=A0A8T3BJI0_DENNO|nr:hypothetical protein KFK09_011903 [Dendrobium nobile]